MKMAVRRSKYIMKAIFSWRVAMANRESSISAWRKYLSGCGSACSSWRRKALAYRNQLIWSCGRVG